MTDDQDDLRRQLSDVDSQLETLRGESQGLAAQVGGQADGPQDQEDTAAAITNAEENAALIAVLEQRRESLRRKLSG